MRDERIAALRERYRVEGPKQEIVEELERLYAAEHPATVISLGTERALRQNDNRMLSPSESLQLALDDIARGEFGPLGPTKAIILLLDDEAGEDGNGYMWGYYQSHIKTSEAIGLLEAAKLRLVRRLVP